MTDSKDTQLPPRNPSNYLLAGATLLAALFVAVQAWYARNSYVEASATRLLETKLDICFDNFDAAASLDAALRLAVPDMAMQEVWPPKVVIRDPAHLLSIQQEIVPHLNALESGLTKASVFGPLDKYRSYLTQQVRGLSKRVLDLNPDALAPENEDNKDTEAVTAQLSDFLGAQYSVFTGCRLVAEGDA